MNKSTDKKKTILDFLNKEYSNAKTTDDVGMMIRLQRAIIAFDYDEIENRFNWNDIMDSYIMSKG